MEFRKLSSSNWFARVGGLHFVGEKRECLTWLLAEAVRQYGLDLVTEAHEQFLLTHPHPHEDIKRAFAACKG
jgi:hypothetical protein